MKLETLRYLEPLEALNFSIILFLVNPNTSMCQYNANTIMCSWNFSDSGHWPIERQGVCFGELFGKEDLKYICAVCSQKTQSPIKKRNEFKLTTL